VTLEPGLLIEVGKSHMAITQAVAIIGLEAGELLWVVSTSSVWQGVALRILTGELVHISSIDAITETPAYVEALR
jgi:hypothetical protein